MEGTQQQHQRPRPKGAPEEAGALTLGWLGELSTEVGDVAGGQAAAPPERRRFDQFVRYQKQRLRRAFQVLGHRDGLTLAALPYLIHMNVNGLPGYLDPEERRAEPSPQAAPQARPAGGLARPGSVSGSLREADLPTGVACFDLNPAIAQAVRTLFPGQLDLRVTKPRPAVEAMFLVGSLGTFGYSRRDRQELWLVVEAARLAPGALPLLEQRLAEISAWAEQVRGSLLPLLVVDAGWLRGEAVAQCPSARSLAALGASNVLERLYSCGLLLMGHPPRWWASAPVVEGAEPSEAPGAADPDWLRSTAIDLGVVRAPSRSSLARGVLREIDQALVVPFEALVRLAIGRELLGQSSPKLPCETFKAALLEGRGAADPYLHELDRATAFLAERQEWETFLLLQKGFYLKVGLKLSASASTRSEFLEQLQQLREYVARWGWDEELVNELDHIGEWNVDRVQRLGESLRDLLVRSYQNLVTAVRRLPSPDPELDREVSLLGRKLTSMVSPKPYKVERLFTHFLDEPLAEERLTIQECRGQKGVWELYRGTPRPGSLELVSNSPLARSRYLLDLLVWLGHNRICGPRTTLTLNSRADLSLQTIKILLRRLDEHFGDGSDIDARAVVSFDEAPVTERAFLVVNLQAADPLARGGLYYLSEQWDLLSYGTQRTNVVADVGLIWRNSWGEVAVRHFYGNDAIIAALSLLLEGQPEQVRSLLHRLEVFCPQPRWATVLPTRLRRTVQALVDFLHDDRASAGGVAWRRFVLEVGGRAIVVGQCGQRLTLRTPLDAGAFWRTLERPGRSGQQQVAVDPQSLALAMLGEVLQVNRLGRVQVFSHAARHRAILIVADEVGGVYREVVRPARHRQRLLELARLLRSHAFGLGGVLLDRLRFAELVHDPRSEHPWRTLDMTESVITQLDGGLDGPVIAGPPVALLVEPGRLRLEVAGQAFDLLDAEARRRCLQQLVRCGALSPAGLRIDRVRDLAAGGAVRALRWARTVCRLLARGR